MIRVRGNARRIVFIQRVMSIWNTLSDRLVEADSHYLRMTVMTVFKECRDEDLNRLAIEGCGPMLEDGINAHWSTLIRPISMLYD